MNLPRHIANNLRKKEVCSFLSLLHLCQDADEAVRILLNPPVIAPGEEVRSRCRNFVDFWIIREWSPSKFGLGLCEFNSHKLRRQMLLQQQDIWLRRPWRSVLVVPWCENHPGPVQAAALLTPLEAWIRLPGIAACWLCTSLVELENKRCAKDTNALNEKSMSISDAASPESHFCIKCFWSQQTYYI